MSQGQTRRQLLRAGAGGMLAMGALGPAGRALANAQWLRRPGSLPDPRRPVGEPTAALPFDHIVILMMENHSFDCYFGMLPRLGQPKADGFSFDALGRPSNRNPLNGGYVVPYRATSVCQGSVTQNWNSTHRQIDGGRMDGFAQTDTQSMVYWTDADLPFYYSLAKTFTLANRWFCSAPCQTYPNRRFLMAGTAYGNISTDTSSIFDPPPPNGTIFDRLSANKLSWRNYFIDLPSSGIIGSVPQKYPANLAPIAEFFTDCAAGTLPAVSLVDPEFGLAGEVGGPLADARRARARAAISAQGQSEENPQDIQLGQNFAARVVERGAALTRLAAHAARLDLRRARRLLRPRAAAEGRSSPTRSRRARPGRRARRLRHLRAARAGGRGLALLAAARRDERRARPHLDPRHDRGEVEPAGADLPRRQRGHARRLPRHAPPEIVGATNVGGTKQSAAGRAGVRHVEPHAAGAPLAGVLPRF